MIWLSVRQNPESDLQHVTEVEPAAKKSKTRLGKVLGDMFSKPAEKRQLPIQEKAKQELS